MGRAMEPLNQEEFKLKIIKDLGREFPRSTSTEKIRYAIFQCNCNNEFKAATKDVKNGKIIGCSKCKVKRVSTTLKNLETGTKKCQTCKEIKLLNEFHNSRTSKDGKTARCKICDSRARKKYYEENEKGRKHAYIKNRNRTLYNKYKITHDEYMELLTKQNNSCGICNITLEQFQAKARSKNGLDKRQKMFAVDHCHKTNKIRGLLCNNCNRAIGLLGDTANNLKNAYNYLLKAETS